MNLDPRPIRPQRVETSKSQPFVDIEELARSLAGSVSQETDLVRLQNTIKELDDILKDIAKLQNTVGKYRKQLGSLASSLRQANPKGKPEEGKVAKVGKKYFIFLSGRWSDYSPPVTKEE